MFFARLSIRLRGLPSILRSHILYLIITNVGSAHNPIQNLLRVSPTLLQYFELTLFFMDCHVGCKPTPAQALSLAPRLGAALATYSFKNLFFYLRFETVSY
jgi:hypothetical protein